MQLIHITLVCILILKGKNAMRNLIIIVVMLLITSCASKLNPEWYPHGTTGKDTVYTFGNGKFSLGKTTDGVDLSMYKNDGDCGIILAFVNQYKSKNGKLYVYSEEGYCVINKDQNTAKVLITVEKQHFSNLVGEDEAIVYLSSYDEFSKEEQEIFHEMRSD